LALFVAFSIASLTISQETSAQETKSEPAATEAAPAEAPPVEATPAETPPAETPPAEAPAAPPTIEERVAKVESSVGDAALAGHNAWMLTSSALVLFMTAPGLAMFYGGLVRKKNVLSVLMQCIFLMGLMTVIWCLYGYSLSFGGVLGEEGYSPFIGNADFLGMKNVNRSFDVSTSTVSTPMEGVIPRYTHMLFQGMFFIITPALICGAFAERMKFSTMVVFMILWGTIVYCPLCHWVWDGGLLAYGSPHGIAGGALDFAGGTVVHISSGVSALICALVIGKRIGFPTEAMPPHNLTYTVIGAGMLWVGWFGFNAGSELASDGLASSAFAVTHFAAAAGTLAWAGMEWITRGKPSVLGAASGAVAGLVVITPAAGFVQPLPALGMGLAAGIVCFLACTKVKSAFGYDDSLDAFGVHGVGGTLGAVLTGIFATFQTADPVLVSGGGKPVGLIDGNTSLIVGQLAAIAVTWVLAAVVTFILLKVLDLTMGLRPTADEELQGLDQTQHGEEGYIFI
jgi:Amt family ammonium transporter